MPYELRQPGQPPQVFETEPEAMAAAKAAIRANPDAVPDVIDTATGQPCAPGATGSDREQFRKNVGF